MIALHEHVAAVSHPTGNKFHQYWTSEKVRKFFKPSNEALDAVTLWLQEEGFSTDNGKVERVTQYGNVLRVSLTCGDANKLLKAQYMFYENNNNGKTHLRVKDGIYNIPSHIHEHIDFMSPTIRFPLQKHTLTVQTMSNKQLDLVRSHTRDSLKKPYVSNAMAGEGDEEESDITPNIPLRIYELYDMTESMAHIIDDEVALDDTVCRQAVASFIEQYYSDCLVLTHCLSAHTHTVTCC